MICVEKGWFHWGAFLDFWQVKLLQQGWGASQLKSAGQWTGCPFGAAVDAAISPPPPLSLMKFYVRSHLVRRRPGTTTSRRLRQVWKQETQSCEAPQPHCSSVTCQKA